MQLQPQITASLVQAICPDLTGDRAAGVAVRLNVWAQPDGLLATANAAASDAMQDGFSTPAAVRAESTDTIRFANALRASLQAHARAA